LEESPDTIKHDATHIANIHFKLSQKLNSKEPIDSPKLHRPPFWKIFACTFQDEEMGEGDGRAMGRRGEGSYGFIFILFTAEQYKLQKASFYHVNGKETDNEESQKDSNGGNNENNDEEVEGEEMNVSPFPMFLKKDAKDRPFVMTDNEEQARRRNTCMHRRVRVGEKRKMN
jgi:hypothetical protein